MRICGIVLLTVSTMVAGTGAVSAQSQTSAPPPATTVPPPPPTQSLPRPDFRYKGQVGRTYQDSDPPTFPQVLRPPNGAPNVLLILLDDVGFGQFSAFGGGVPSPNMEKLAAQGLRYTRFHGGIIKKVTINIQPSTLNASDQQVVRDGERAAALTIE